VLGCVLTSCFLPFVVVMPWIDVSTSFNAGHSQ
jgi:hypothetical protein